MEKETTGTVISVATQWWLKINTKPVRLHALDGAIFPYIIKVRYTADGKDYFKRKWIRAGDRGDYRQQNKTCDQQAAESCLRQNANSS